jgi:TonB family protein
MHPILLYLLKMLICSCILYGYYRVTLYNERFHQWNRFYLLAAMLLSVFIPFIEIPVSAETSSPGLVYIIETIPGAIVAKATPVITTAQIVWAGIGLVSIVLFIRLFIGLYLTVYKPYRKGEVSSREDIDVVITETPSAPYSFFSLLFWRSDMDPDSPHGKRVLLHELTHIRERHSADKLFVELILVVCWFNPFFWLIRKELYVIHEFLADSKAIEQNNGAAFAEMILQTMNAGHLSPLTNPFFSSHLKRRLKMITTSNKPQFSYLRRITALVAMVTISFVLMLTLEKGFAQQAPPPPPPPPPPPAAPLPPPPPPKVDLPDSIKSINVQAVNGVAMATITLKNGKVRKMPVEEAMKKGYPIPPPPPPPPAPAPPPPPPPALADINITVKGNTSMRFEAGKEPLVIYAGLAITQEQLNQINPDQIESIDVLKGESAVALYGEKGKNGVIRITPKTQIYTQNKGNRNDPNEVVVVGYAQKTKTGSAPGSSKIVMGYPLENPPLHILDGKIISIAELDAIDPSTIETVKILKDQKAIDAYGEKGKYGVIEMKLKKVLTVEEEHKKIFTSAEKMPAFPGGGEGWTRHLQKNLRYPDKAIDKGIQGVAKVTFMVDNMGNLSDFEIVQNPGSGLGEEALRVIKEGPNWEPAEQNGKLVNAKVTQTVTFWLE